MESDASVLDCSHCLCREEVYSDHKMQNAPALATIAVSRLCGQCDIHPPTCTCIHVCLAHAHIIILCIYTCTYILARGCTVCKYKSLCSLSLSLCRLCE